MTKILYFIQLQLTLAKTIKKQETLIQYHSIYGFDATQTLTSKPFFFFANERQRIGIQKDTSVPNNVLHARFAQVFYTFCKHVCRNVTPIIMKNHGHIACLLNQLLRFSKRACRRCLKLRSSKISLHQICRKW